MYNHRKFGLLWTGGGKVMEAGWERFLSPWVENILNHPGEVVL